MTEPFFTEIPPSIEMVIAYNWYGENKSWADSKKYILTHLDKEGNTEAYEKVKKLPESGISWVCGWICRLIDQGSKVDPNSLVYLNKWIAEL